MVTKEELRRIVILSYLTDEMLDKLRPVVDVLRFDKEELVFKEGSPADRFYLLKRGKILLEQSISDSITLSLGSVKPGYSLGWSATLSDEHYTSNAICAEPCEVFSIQGEKLKKLLDEDHSMGYRLSQRFLRVIKKRHDIRTELLVKVIINHPDMKKLLETDEE